MDKIFIDGIEQLEDFTETAYRKKLEILNLNDFSVELNIHTTTTLVKLEHSRVVISKKKKLPLSVEIQGNLQKPEAILFDYVGQIPNSVNKKVYIIRQKVEDKWNLVSLTPLLLGFFVMEVILAMEAYFSPNSVSPWLYFSFGLVLMFVQFKCWPLSLRT